MRVSRAIAGLGRAHSSAILALATMVVILTACDGSFLGPGPVDEIAKVRLSLESHTFTALEESLTVEAEALDGSGTRVPDVTLEWQSSDPSIVSVDPMGTVTAKAAGAALVIVAVAAAADTAFFTVEEEGAQHQPTGDGLWFSDEFESGNTSHSQNGFRWNNPNWNVSTEHSYSGSHALRFHYPGMPRGQDHNSELRFTIAETPAEAPTEMWIEYMLRVPDNLVVRYESDEWGHDGAGKNGVALYLGGLPYSGSIDAGSDILTFDQAWVPDYLFNSNNPTQAALRWVANVQGAGDGGSEWTEIAVTDRISASQLRLADVAPTGVTGADVTFRNRSASRPSNNKFFIVWAESYAGTSGGGSGADARFLMEFNPYNENGQTAAPRLSYVRGAGADKSWSDGPWRDAIKHISDDEEFFREEDRGEWVQVRLHLLLHDTDGQYRLWRNGTLIYSMPSGYQTTRDQGYDYFRKGYLMGWANSGYSEDTTFYIDDFKLYVSDPGW